MKIPYQLSLDKLSYNQFKTLFRDRFFDETSCWCLPTKILELAEEQSNSIGQSQLYSQSPLTVELKYDVPM